MMREIIIDNLEEKHGECEIERICIVDRGKMLIGSTIMCT